ncbi:DUF998 domain-containing protein [Limimaricola hongkongensis]|uniref:DUF998 domain-containing protein n=1 Tax=Limimaricola hongkongensis DSM 17492 TaxID=1122180 RepID=A0A017HD71_9RHOB|nr:DUF998 domain-containing protein [Limimaricola hongkongensis]EYD71744.1 hypothetical protein Lokhon_01814 [Limimaricola hongkongensis DSM 17492]
MKDAAGQPIDAERPYLLLLAAGIGFLGCLSLIGGTIAAQIVVPGHDWIADTISDLGAGEWEIIMDVALYGFAAGLFAMALAAAHAHLGGIGWSAGVFSLAILAALVVIVGARNEYGDGDNEGVVIHIYLVYGLGALFLAAPLSMAAGFGRHHPRARLLLIGLAVAWGVMAPLFLMAPTTIDGLAERGLGLVACGIIAVMSWVFWMRGRDAGAAR